MSDRRPPRRALAPWAAAFALWSYALLGGLPAPGRAQDDPPPSRRTCAAAFEQAQERRVEGQLLSAHALLKVCARKECGRIVRRECTVLFDELGPQIPTVVLSLEDEQGLSMSEAEVTLDGTPLDNPLDGRALSVDPGLRTFTFVLPDGRRLEQTVTIQEGIKNRQVAVTLEPTKPRRPAPTLRPATPLPPPASSGPATPLPTKDSGGSALPYVFGGVGLVGLAGFGVFGTMGAAEHNALPRCWPDCNPAQVTRAQTLYTAANISLGAGGLALGVGVLLWLLDGDGEEDGAPKATVTPVLRPTAGGALTGFSAKF